MKTGRTLVQLAEEITRQRDTRQDFIAPTKKLEVVVVEERPKALYGEGGQPVAIGRSADVRIHLPTPTEDIVAPLNDLAHRQLGEHLKIPATYYDRMREEDPELLATNINTWLHRSDEVRMCRFLDRRLRAFLSDKFRPLENADLAAAALPVLMQRQQGENGLSVVSCEITERRLYIKAVDKAVVRQIDGRHIVDGHQVDYDHASPSITISNSEVGCGALTIERGLFKHRCRNMSIFTEKALRKYHVGAKHELTEQLGVMLSEATRRVTDAALWMQVGDVVNGALDEVFFDKALEPVRAMAGDRIQSTEIVKVVEVASRQFGINEGERGGVLKHLIEGGDLSRYGLFNAITRAAEDLGDYDRATEFERIGGQVIELPSNDWRRIAEAA